MQAEQGFVSIVTAHPMLLSIACFGGLVLFGIKVVEHFNKAPENKFSNGRYTLWAIFLFLVLPFLGGAMVLIYLANGDQISPVLAFQVGLTSPAIVQSMIIAAANNLAKEPVQVRAGQ